MILDVILIGPIRAGKSTIGEILARRLGLPQVSLDELCWNYYQEIGFNSDGAVSRGPDGMIASRFNLHAVERLLAQNTNCVIDLGAGHSVYREADSLARVESLLMPYPNVVLLLPDPDLAESLRVLNERNAENPWLNDFRKSRGYDPNEHFLRHPSNFRLAKTIIYTNGQTPDQTADAILTQTHTPYQ